MPLRKKITLFFLTITGTLLLLSLYFIYFFSIKERERIFESRLEEKTLTQANLFFNALQIDSNVMRVLEQHRKDLYKDEKLIIYSESLKPIYESRYFFDSEKKKHKQFIPNLHLQKQFFHQNGNVKILGMKFSRYSTPYYFFIQAIDQDGLNTHQKLRWNLFYIFLLMMLLLGIFARFFANRIINTLDVIIQEMEKISTNNLKIRLHSNNSKDEIDRLVGKFNELLDRLETSFEIQKKFTSNVSHELKNPIASLISQLEVALLKATPNEKPLILSLLEDIQIINKITESMILLTRIESLRKEENFSMERIDELLYTAVDHFKKIRSDAKVIIHIEQLPDIEDHLLKSVNEELMLRCFINIIENAYKYSTNKECYIFFEQSNESMSITFKNNFSYQTTVKDQDLLMKPFQRGTTEKKYQGHGIGLSIVEQILKIHYFVPKINISDNEFTFVITEK